MNPTPTDFRGRLTVLIPVFNDWAAVCLLLPLIDEALRGLSWTVSVILVDDGSTEELPANLLSQPPSSLEQVEVLRLNRNLGHQRAIAIGLSFVQKRGGYDALVVMDGDGEDSPADIPRLLSRFEALGGRRVVFAERRRRTEGWLFRGFYHLYRLLHRVLTGVAVRVGNFSVLPPGAVGRLVVDSDLWNHYAACVFKSGIPRDLLPTARGIRLHGSSRMNFPSLVTHGLSAISVFGERVGVRGMVFSSVFVSLAMFSLGGLVALRAFTDVPVPGWAGPVGGLALVLSVQLLASVTVFAFVVLGGRHSSGFLPIRDHEHFILERISVYES